MAVRQTDSVSNIKFYFPFSPTDQININDHRCLGYKVQAYIRYIRYRLISLYTLAFYGVETVLHCLTHYTHASNVGWKIWATRTPRVKLPRDLRGISRVQTSDFQSENRSIHHLIKIECVCVCVSKMPAQNHIYQRLWRKLDETCSYWLEFGMGKKRQIPVDIYPEYEYEAKSSTCPLVRTGFRKIAVQRMRRVRKKFSVQISHRQLSPYHIVWWLVRSVEWYLTDFGLKILKSFNKSVKTIGEQ